MKKHIALKQNIKNDAYTKKNKKSPAIHLFTQTEHMLCCMYMYVDCIQVQKPPRFNRRVITSAGETGKPTVIYSRPTIEPAVRRFAFLRTTVTNVT